MEMPSGALIRVTESPPAPEIPAFVTTVALKSLATEHRIHRPSLDERFWNSINEAISEYVLEPPVTADELSEVVPHADLDALTRSVLTGEHQGKRL
jgi:hypothetical protein